VLIKDSCLLRTHDHQLGTSLKSKQGMLMKWEPIHRCCEASGGTFLGKPNERKGQQINFCRDRKTQNAISIREIRVSFEAAPC
jgi:hypothetical protein